MPKCKWEILQEKGFGISANVHCATIMHNHIYLSRAQMTMAIDIFWKYGTPHMNTYIQLQWTACSNNAMHIIN